MKCTCYSFHLCGSHACKKLPWWVEDLARETYNYFSSLKQSMVFKEFQEFVNVKPHKIIYPSQTRWLSLISVVKRLLEENPARKLFFALAVLKGRLQASQSVLQKLNDLLSKLYPGFLDYVLPSFKTLIRKCKMRTYRFMLLVVESLRSSLLYSSFT